MKLILFLLRASWRIALLAAFVGGVSGAASVALVAMILRTVEDPERLVGRCSSACSRLCAAWCCSRRSCRNCSSRG